MKNSLIVLSLIIVFFSCKKDTQIIPLVSNSPNNIASQSDSLLPLAVGNYWIYEKSNDDTLGGMNLQGIYDSVYIAKDTFIAGEQYFKFCHTNNQFLNYFRFNHNGYQFIKDSAGYLVTIEQNLLLDTVHIQDTIFINNMPPERLCLVPDKFSNKQFLAGTFSGNIMKTIYFRTAPTSYFTDTICSAYFAKGIGLVKDQYAYSGCWKYCRYSNNLIRYHLN